jgi:hypothetical protein
MITSESTPLPATTHHQPHLPVALKRSVDRPDLVVNDNPPVDIDVKCHLDQWHKRLFLVNEQVRMRSIRREVVRFIP